jgi:hypothetical protein
MSKGVSVIRTALTTRLQLELSYREHCPEPEARVSSSCLDEAMSDFVAMSDSGDSLKLSALRAL